MTAQLQGVWHHALELSQEHGLAVFPVAEGAKVPAVRKEDGGRGCHDGTTSAEQVCAWADEFPRANFGVACGGWRNLYVIDFDRLDALADFAERFGDRPLTATARTPKPGRHEYYTAPPGVRLHNSASKLAVGVDTRGHGGYVVGPGSMLHDGRRYAWQAGRSPADVGIAPLPDSIVAALRPSLPVVRELPARIHEGDLTARVAGYIRTLPSLRDGEGRNQTCYRLAAFVLHDCHGTRTDAETACAVWNARNSEPLDGARALVIVANAAMHGGRAYAA